MGLPLGARGVDGGVVGNNVNVGRLFRAEELVEDAAEDRLEAGGDDVEGNGVGDAAVTGVASGSFRGRRDKMLL